LERRTEELLNGLEENIKFFLQLGITSVSSASPVPPIEERICQCQRCPLSNSRKNAVPGEGNRNADLMFVGEAPGRDEDMQGKPFIGRAGQLLTRIIKAMNYERGDVYITNVVKCRPPKNREPNPDEIEACQAYLLEQIDLIDPRVIVTLGNVAAHFFIPSRSGVTALRGNFYPFNDILVMPTFHPSYLVRNQGNRELKKMVWEDMKKVMAFLSKK
jgi:uracil-DNA glycosylase family 4